MKESKAMSKEKCDIQLTLEYLGIGVFERIIKAMDPDLQIVQRGAMVEVLDCDGDFICQSSELIRLITKTSKHLKKDNRLTGYLNAQIAIKKALGLRVTNK
jgi:translation elongation factor EF-Ts